MSVSQPLASDEYGRRNFNFQVYFRPDERAPEVRAGLTEKWPHRRGAEPGGFEGYFQALLRAGIDEAESHLVLQLCGGTWDAR